MVARDYVVEERMTLEVSVTQNGEVIARNWALNEVTVEKASRERMLEVTLEVDGRPLSTFGCDGVVMATPTGSTAYAFSAGGPVVWPDVEAMLVVPISAHAPVRAPAGRRAEVCVGHRDARGHRALRCDVVRWFAYGRAATGRTHRRASKRDTGAPGPSDVLALRRPAGGQVRPVRGRVAWTVPAATVVAASVSHG